MVYRLPLVAFFILLFTFAQGAALLEQWTPSQSDIADLERRIRMPAGSDKPLASYRRYYAGTLKDGRKTIVGVLLVFRPSGVEIVKHENLPLILDGGCGVINVEFLVDTKAFVSISCNGEA